MNWNKCSNWKIENFEDDNSGRPTIRRNYMRNGPNIQNNSLRHSYKDYTATNTVNDTRNLDLNWGSESTSMKTNLSIRNSKNYSATNDEYDDTNYILNWNNKNNDVVGNVMGNVVDNNNKTSIETFTGNDNGNGNGNDNGNDNGNGNGNGNGNDDESAPGYDGIDSRTNTVTLTQQELQELVEKASDLNTSHLSYTTGEFQVNDAYYTTTGDLSLYKQTHTSQNKADMILMSGIDKVHVNFKETKDPKMTFDNDTNIPFNYYYNQTIDPNTTYPYDTEDTPITRDENYPFFENRYDRPTTFDGTSHTYMTPKNWRFPEKKAPDCKKQEEPNKPSPLDRNYITLDQWDSQIGTILPEFTYRE
jgi:hypothetical protein